MICLSACLHTYHPTAVDSLTAALEAHNVPYRFLSGTRDIWLRDFMPVRTGSGRLISFRYAPSYLNGFSALQTNFREEIAPQLHLPVRYSDINMDGGNVVYSPLRRKAIVSDRVFSENPSRSPAALVRELENWLEAEIIIIPSLKSDMTGHADGMVRFVDEYTAIGNDVPSANGLERRIKYVLRNHGIDVIDFPYQDSRDISAVGCYLNYLETENCIFLPMFGLDMDKTAVGAAARIFSKGIVPVRIYEIAKQGGCLNCISWEMNE